MCVLESKMGGEGERRREERRREREVFFPRGLRGWMLSGRTFARDTFVDGDEALLVCSSGVWLAAQAVAKTERGTERQIVLLISSSL